MSVYHHAPAAWRRGTRAATIAAALAILAMVSMPETVMRAQGNKPGQPAAPPATKRPSDWDRFTADITLKRSHVDAKGKPRDTMPDVRYHWERTKRGGGWNTSLTIVSRGQQVVQTVNGPKSVDVPGIVARMEDDEDGSPLRFYGADGKEIRVPTPKEADHLPGFTPPPAKTRAAAAALQPSPTPRPGATGKDWADAILVPPGKKDDRRKSIERQFGRSRGQVGRLDRFSSIAPDGTDREVLIDPQHALPVEINASRGGKLLSHTSFEYESQADGSVLRRRVRTEQRMADASDDRLVTEIELGNVRFDRKAGAR